MSIAAALNRPPRRRRGTGGALVSDTFTRADSTSTLGNAETGQAWSAPVAGSTWGISSNQAYQPQSASNAPAVLDAGVSDCTIQVTIATIGAGDAGICFRCVDSLNFFEFSMTATTYVLWRVVAGGFTQIASGSLTGNNGDVLKVVLSGSTIKLFQNGAQLGTNVTDTNLQTATKHGLTMVSPSTAARWDSFTITTP